MGILKENSLLLAQSGQNVTENMSKEVNFQ